MAAQNKHREQLKKNIFSNVNMDNPLSSSVKSESAESGKPPDLAESLSSVEQLKILSRACG